MSQNIILVFCIVFCGGVRVKKLNTFLYSDVVTRTPAGFVSLIFLVFCVVFCGGVRIAHLFSFLCCFFWRGSCRSSF